MNWELGKSSPQPDTIIMIADALGVEPADLMLEY
jgi:transcriptional regulator with XRE-family HTH domain